MLGFGAFDFDNLEFQHACEFDSSNDFIALVLQDSPTVVAEYDVGEISSYEALFTRYSLITGDDQLECRFFSRTKETTVFEESPAHLDCCADLMSDERAPKLAGHVVIEKNLQTWP